MEGKRVTEPARTLSGDPKKDQLQANKEKRREEKREILT
jgi:hypothetical protein